MSTILGILTLVAIGIVAVGTVGALAFTGTRPRFWHWRPAVPKEADRVELPSMDNYIPWI